MYTPICQAWKTKIIPKHSLTLAHSLTPKEFSWIYIITLLLSTRPWCVRVHIVLCSFAAGHLSSRPENASSKSVLFFRSVAAISFSSDETKSRGLRVGITYICYNIHMFSPGTTEDEDDKTRLPPRARINILQVNPPTHPHTNTHHSSTSVWRSCVYAYPLYIHYIIAVIIICVSCHSRIVEFEYLRLSRGWIWSPFTQKRRVCRCFALCIYTSGAGYLYRGRNGITLTPMPLVLVVVLGSKKYRVVWGYMIIQ